MTLPRRLPLSHKLITLASFSTETEASIVRHRLEADGIRAFLADEVTAGMAWHLGTAIGGIKLQVAQEDVHRAMAILETNDPVPIADDDWQSCRIRTSCSRSARSRQTSTMRSMGSPFSTIQPSRAHEDRKPRWLPRGDHSSRLGAVTGQAPGSRSSR